VLLAAKRETASRLHRDDLLVEVKGVLIIGERRRDDHVIVQLVAQYHIGLE
jgi:hypothetical protein